MKERIFEIETYTGIVLGLKTEELIHVDYIDRLTVHTLYLPFIKFEYKIKTPINEA